MGKQRNKRISEEIKKVVSGMIMSGIKDPRISKMTSITHVDTTNDLRFTNIYISVYDPKADPIKTLDGLNSAKGYIRKEIGSALKLHFTPEPIFKMDNSIENGLYINSLLKSVGADELVKRDTIEADLEDDEFDEDEEDEDFYDEDEDDDFDDEDNEDEDEDSDDDEDDYEEDEDEDEEEQILPNSDKQTLLQ